MSLQVHKLMCLYREGNISRVLQVRIRLFYNNLFVDDTQSVKRSVPYVITCFRVLGRKFLKYKITCLSFLICPV